MFSDVIQLAELKTSGQLDLYRSRRSDGEGTDIKADGSNEFNGVHWGKCGPLVTDIAPGYTSLRRN